MVDTVYGDLPEELLTLLYFLFYFFLSNFPDHTPSLELLNYLVSPTYPVLHFCVSDR